MECVKLTDQSYSHEDNLYFIDQELKMRIKQNAVKALRKHENRPNDDIQI